MVYADTLVFASPGGEPLKRITANQYLSIIDIRMLGRAWYFQSVLQERTLVEDEFNRVISALPEPARSASPEGTIAFLNQYWRTTLSVDEACDSGCHSLMLERSQHEKAHFVVLCLISSVWTDTRNIVRHP